MKKILLAGVALVSAAISFGASAAPAPFPSQPVTLVVPTPAAGPLDLFARLMAPELSSYWNKPVVVRNQPGAGTALGTQAVARAKPDGHTLLVANIAISAHGALSQNPLFDVEKDLQPITLLASTPFFLLTPQKGHRSVAELIQAARKDPKKLNFAIIPNSQQHLDTERVLTAAGIEATLIPYQGTAPITLALLAHEVDAFLGSLGGMQDHLRLGNIQALASTGVERSAHLPDVPTLRELGVNVDFEPWYAMFAPAGVSPEVLEQLRTAILGALAKPEIQQKISAAGYDPKVSTVQELAQIVSNNLQLSREIVKAANIQPQ